MKTLALVGTHGGGDSALVAYNLAWMYAHSGFKVLCVDLTTAARLSDRSLDSLDLGDIWASELGYSLFGALWPLVMGHEDRGRLRVFPMGETPDGTLDDSRRRLFIAAGDPALARFAEPFERAWLGATPAPPEPRQALLACRELIRTHAVQLQFGVTIIDLGEERTALTRAGLLAADASITVTAPTPASQRAFETLAGLRSEWRARWSELTPGDVRGLAEPLGNVYIPASAGTDAPPPDCLGHVHFARTFGQMSREARKPMFLLTPSDGASGGYAAAVFDVRREWQALARAIADRAGIEWPASSD